ncbi:Protease/lipase ABC transporter permease/ATP-binding protein [Rubrivivax sp. A210]|uniref:type I secretion system permease/ATPase n=1 Tax=Rubrivivax sp. A210 TaxID=2772301 RepID=UPI0019193AB4|nr:type I secretion system permease/ATPase [Rubrivivax sp. A210]CAD5369108.1 Protease/lipase ABC transporter permease/ATP-binding protein [Rubrivivax sp. A210]
MSEATPSPAAAAQPPPGWDIDNDALAHALSWLTRHHGRERSPESMLAGLPLSGRLAPDQALRALREAGYSAGLVQRRVAELNSLLLPALLLLKEGDACILVARHADDPRCYDIVMPGREHHACMATEGELEAEYTGLAIVATPQATVTASQAAGQPLAQQGRHWLWSTMRRFLPYYRSALMAAMLSNVLMLVTGMATSVIYDKVIPHQAYVTLWTLATASALALAFDLMARQLRAHLIDVAGRKADLIVGAMLFRHTLGMRMEQRPASAGAYAHQVAQVEMVREFFASATLAAISDLPFIVIFVGMAFSTGGPLGWVLVVAIPLLLVVSAVIQGSLRRAMTENMAQTADLHGVLVEAVDGIEDLKAAGAQGRFLRRYEEATAAAATAMLHSRSITAWTMNLSSIAQQVVTMVMLVWGVFLIDEKVITGGALIGAVMFATRAVAPLASVTSLATRYQGARAAMRTLDYVMQQPVERDATRVYVPKREFSGRVGLADVGFSYPAQTDGTEGPRVLKGLTLRFEPGERVAILGRIGSGKSTVLRLLAGLYQPSEGLVEVDGIDLRQIDPADYRVRVGFVSQDPRLFTGTLRDNVLLDRPGADPARLADVARLTGLDRLVAGHPKGWELPVGEAGALLSGGQRQLVALARCLVTQPQILLMDEPTSSMDAQSEVAFLRQLKEACGNCTLVMVTHRPAVLELVNRVVVVDAGRVVMDGPKDQVLAVLSGGRPAVAPPGAPNNIHLHPSARPVEREASV